MPLTRKKSSGILDFISPENYMSVLRNGGAISPYGLDKLIEHFYNKKNIETQDMLDILILLEALSDKIYTADKVKLNVLVAKYKFDFAKLISFINNKNNYKYYADVIEVFNHYADSLDKTIIASIEHNFIKFFSAEQLKGIANNEQEAMRIIIFMSGFPGVTNFSIKSQKIWWQTILQLAIGSTTSNKSYFISLVVQALDYNSKIAVEIKEFLLEILTPQLSLSEKITFASKLSSVNTVGIIGKLLELNLLANIPQVLQNQYSSLESSSIPLNPMVIHHARQVSTNDEYGIANAINSNFENSSLQTLSYIMDSLKKLQQTSINEVKSTYSKPSHCKITVLEENIKEMFAKAYNSAPYLGDTPTLHFKLIFMIKAKNSAAAYLYKEIYLSISHIQGSLYNFSDSNMFLNETVCASDAKTIAEYVLKQNLLPATVEKLVTTDWGSPYFVLKQYEYNGMSIHKTRSLQFFNLLPTRSTTPADVVSDSKPDRTVPLTHTKSLPTMKVKF